MFYLVLWLRFLRLLCFTSYCDYVLLGIVTTFSQVAMFYLVLWLRFLRLLCFTWYCDYVFSGYYVLLFYCDYVFSGCHVLLAIVTTFSQVAMFYLVL